MLLPLLSSPSLRRHFCLLTSIASLSIAPFAYTSKKDSAWANTRQSHSAVGRAEEKFRSENYDQAIQLLQYHLRRRPKDFHAWNLLGASYYHTGLPKRGLRHLRSVYQHTSNKSYNLFYQGLCYLLMNQQRPAKLALTNAARYLDEYGSRATFEMALLEYNARDHEKAMYWLNLYLQRYPTGAFARTAQQMVQSLSRATYISGIEGNKKPDMEKALFRYNRYSLSNKPHFWYLQLGGNYELAAARVPVSGGGTRAAPEEASQLIASAGIGIGPVSSGDSLAWAGYNYKQEWNTDRERIDTWLDDPLDREYQPFRTDIMDRTHQFFGDYRRTLSDNFYLGVYGRLDFVRSGSSLFSGPEAPELQRSARLKERNVIIPWIGANYLKNYYTLFYLYLRKEINVEAPHYSNKTFDLFDSDTPAMSYGISHSMLFPEQNLSVNIEGFLYEFIYNYQWLDYTRLGAIAAASYEFYPRFIANVLAGFYSDSYQLPRLKQNNCAYTPRNETSGQESNLMDGQGSTAPLACTRNDDGLLYGAGLTWNYSQFRRLEVSYMHVQNRNPQQNVYDKSKNVLTFTATFAFPSVERVMRYIDRFADTAFTKEAE